ncbi:MAG TPA: amino acid permease, partial [Firmicutes bacterium]|nr:amino acid permease [Bacillota bacterium]
MAKNKNRGYGFGTTPVFLASISTILGAILFLRFGYAVSNAGLIGTILLVLIAHLITIPSALAISEIATNMRVEGGGEYYIISRSFGKIIGGSIGISLYFARAISVAFYMVAFADAFRPINQYLMTKYGIWIDLRIISLLFFGLITWIQLWKGANMGVNILWGVFLILIASVILFLFGKPLPGTVPVPLTFKIKGADPMFKVFAIIFPAFTGMAAGVGLSGDLKKPERSIPIGILSATITGMFIYILVAIKLHSSAPMSLLASDPLVMSKIALWGPIIPLGLAAATISSAISSSIVAPRILQALGNDNVLPGKKINRFFAKGKGKVNEPVNATAFTVLLVILFILPGSLDFIAQLITMFFIITYGILCWISFLEHMAANPSFRPVFHTKWYISLIGGIMSIIVIFQIQP